MGRFTLYKILVIVLFSLFIFSCSTVRVVPEGSSRLKENKIVIKNSKKIKASILEPYLRQKPNSTFLFGINPFLHIYNWNNGKNNGWNRLVKSIGQQPVIFDSTMVSKSKINLNNHLEYLGYYHSIVDPSIVTKSKKTSVTYAITLGNRYKLNQIRYDIKDSAIKKIIFADTLNTLIKRNDYLSEMTLSEESDRITTILRNKGYYNFTKNYLFFEADTLKHDGNSDLVIKIKNYTRNETAKEAKPHNKFYIRKVIIQSDYNPTSRLDTLALPDSLKYGDVSIYYNGKLNIKPSVLAKMNKIIPGDLYNESVANNTYERFVTLRYFSGVNLQFDEVKKNNENESDKREVDCTIRLTPSKSQGYKINLEVSSNSNNLLGVSPAISYYHKNIFRGGEWFSLGFMGNFQFKLNDPARSSELGVSTGLSVPGFLLLPDKIFTTTIPRTDIVLSYNFQSRTEFTRNLLSLNYGYNWKRGERFFYRINPIQLNVIKLYNLSPQFYKNLSDPFLRNSYKNNFDLGSGATLLYTTDASPNPKKSYFYLRWVNDISGNLISLFNKAMPTDTNGFRTILRTAYAQYYRTDLTMVYTWKFENKTSFATRFNLGIGHAYGNSATIPFEKLFYAGGANSLRGWQARSVGPGSAPIDTTFSIPNQTGDFKLELNAEYRFGLFWKVEGALFADAGNIWNLRAEEGKETTLFRMKDFYKSIAFNWGTGLRLNLNFVILRLDLGMIAYDPTLKYWVGTKDWFKPNTFSLQFGIGYPF
ncbi:MAG: BamA/TamA family outer membrane protein [Rikenellaceae bacterium]